MPSGGPASSHAGASWGQHGETTTLPQHFPDDHVRYDPNAVLSIEQSIWFAHRIRDLRNDYFEDPTWGLNGMRQVRDRTKDITTIICVTMSSKGGNWSTRTAPLPCRSGPGLACGWTVRNYERTVSSIATLALTPTIGIRKGPIGMLCCPTRSGHVQSCCLQRNRDE